MRQQEYNEIQDIKRDLLLFIVALLAILGLMVVFADASENECVNWEWKQIGSHTECSGWYCWTVPEYSFICTEYAQDPEPIIIQPTPIQTYKQPTSIGFAYTFGHNDVDRYQIQKNISDMRAIYIMENIAWSNGLTREQFEMKFMIK